MYCSNVSKVFIIYVLCEREVSCVCSKVVTYLLTFSSSLLVEHRAFTTSRHLQPSMALALALLQGILVFRSSMSRVLRQVFVGLPLRIPVKWLDLINYRTLVRWTDCHDEDKYVLQIECFTSRLNKTTNKP